MARAAFAESIQDSSGAALGNITVSVYLAGTTTLATIYANRSGTAKSNPFSTGVDGMATFWADVGDYDVSFVDSQVPARVGAKTIGWVAAAGQANSVGTAQIADNSIVLAKMADDSVGGAEITANAVGMGELTGLASGQIPVGNGSGVTARTMGGAGTLDSSGNLSITRTGADGADSGLNIDGVSFVDINSTRFAVPSGVWAVYAKTVHWSTVTQNFFAASRLVFGVTEYDRSYANVLGNALGAHCSLPLVGTITGDGTTQVALQAVATAGSAACWATGRIRLIKLS